MQLQFKIWNKMLVSVEKKSELSYFQNKLLKGKQLDSYENVWKTGVLFAAYFLKGNRACVLPFLLGASLYENTKIAAYILSNIINF